MNKCTTQLQKSSGFSNALNRIAGVFVSLLCLDLLRLRGFAALLTTLC